MPDPPILSRVAVALGLAVPLAACGDSGDRVTPPPSAQPGATATTPPATEQSGAQSCAAPERGYRLEFPKQWFTNEAGIAEPCRFFHPEPFTLAPQTEATGIAINVRLNPAAFREVTPTPESSPGSEVLGHRTTTIDGRPAVRAETSASMPGLLPRGTRVTGWFVDTGDGTLVATTSEVAGAGRYEDNVKVLDAMMQSLRLSDRKSTSSTGRSAPSPARQPELPEAVSAIRMASPSATRDAGVTTLYLWPAASAFERRVAESGDWMFFLGGD